MQTYTIRIKEQLLLANLPNKAVDTIKNPNILKSIRCMQTPVIFFSHPFLEHKKQLVMLSEAWQHSSEILYSFIDFLKQKLKKEVGYKTYQCLMLSPTFWSMSPALPDSTYYYLWLEEGLPIEEKIIDITLLNELIFQKAEQYPCQIQFIFDLMSINELEEMFIQADLSSSINTDDNTVLSNAYNIEFLNPFKPITHVWSKYMIIAIMGIVSLSFIVWLFWLFFFQNYLSLTQLDKAYQVIAPITEPDFIQFQNGHCSVRNCNLSYTLPQFAYEEAGQIKQKLTQHLQKHHMQRIKFDFQLPSFKIYFRLPYSWNRSLSLNKQAFQIKLTQFLADPYIQYEQNTSYTSIGIPRVFFEDIWPDLKNVLQHKMRISNIYFNKQYIWIQVHYD